MSRKEKSTHALFLKWRELEIGAFGIPAILAVIVITILLARWFGVV